MSPDRSSPPNSHHHHNNNATHVRSNTSFPPASHHSPSPSRILGINSSFSPSTTTTTAGDSQSHHPPMTTSTSASTSSSEAPVTDHQQPSSSSAATANGATPYGTRSRGRNAPRPNYAEDRDIDVDLEVAPASGFAAAAATSSSTSTAPTGAGAPATTSSSNTNNNPSSSKSAKRNNIPAPNTAANGTATKNDPAAEKSSSRKNQYTAANGHAASSKDKDKDRDASIPGTSSFSAKTDDAGTATAANTTANPTAASASNASRKRKQPASNAANAHTASNGNPAKKVFTTAPGLVPGQTDSNMVSFDKRGAYLVDGILTADDGTTFAVNDHVYLICEPPGEPYYLARIMEFLPSKTKPSGPIEALRVNWYYRPRDIQRAVADMRLVFASMHSDTCPLGSLRGKCHIRHVSEVDHFAEYRKSRDCFWYERMFDRYIHRYYDVIPTSKVINVPANVKKVLDDRWKFVLVEMGKRKELTAAVKTCKRCSLYAANTDSVDCAVCRNTYHMYCVRPALTKKPARGFAWACAACSRAQERKLEARNTPTLGDSSQVEGGEEEMEEEEESTANGTKGGGSHAGSGSGGSGGSTPAAVEDTTVHPATEEQTAQARMWPFRYLGIHCRVEDALDYDDRIYPRASSRLGPRHQATVHPWPGRPVEYVQPKDVKKRYLKSSNKTRDSKLGKETVAALEAVRQEIANRPKWVVDLPTGYVQRGEDKPVQVDRKPVRTSTLLWSMPTPSSRLSSIRGGGSGSGGGEEEEEEEGGRGGGGERGEGESPGSHLSQEERERFVDDYMTRAREMAPTLGLEKHSTNFLDKALELLYAHSYDTETALAKLKKVNKYKELKEPHLRPEEVKSFEQGVSLYGSELRNVTKHVGTVPHYQIVRFYYVWKKTPRGKQIWGNYEGRRGKKESKRDTSAAKLADDVADDQDDSAFDAEKALDRKRGFTCRFCATQHSRQWRRAPGVQPGTTVPAEGSSSSSSSSSAGNNNNNNNNNNNKNKGPQLMVALCLRCAQLWRKYGIQWENVDEVARKISQSGNKSWRRRMDEELLVQLLVASEMPISLSSGTAASATALGVPITETIQQDHPPPAPAKKKGGRLAAADKESASTATSVEPPATTTAAAAAATGATSKKKAAAAAAAAAAAEKVPEPSPVVPDPPKAKTLPCAVCHRVEPVGDDQHVSCRDCRLTVHRNCYGVSPSRNGGKWLCDMCSNDRSPMISTCYECVLCPVTWTEHELMEPPKVSHKRKTDRDREKERLEKEMVQEAIKLYRQRQEAVAKPIGPREPLKRTVGNNWIHVMCAVWTPEIKFGQAAALEPAEGFGFIPPDRYREVCKICKTNNGACVPCHHSSCHAHFHIGCAFQAQYRFGFDLTPIKSSRRDSGSGAVVRLGQETGVASAGIWCPHHPVTPAFHDLGEATAQEDRNALQRFVQTYKQADLSLTGAVRKAAHVQQQQQQQPQPPPVQHHPPHGHHRRRSSGVNGVDPQTASEPEEMEIDSEPPPPPRPPSMTPDVDRLCTRCSTGYSPRWWPLESSRRMMGQRPLLNGMGPYPPSLGVPEAPLYECHKCHLKGAAAPAPPGPAPVPGPQGPTPGPAPQATATPEPRPAYTTPTQRPVLPAPRFEYSQPYAPTHATPPSVLPRPTPGPAPTPAPEWHSGYEHSLPVGYSPGPHPHPHPHHPSAHPPPPPHPMNGYHPPFTNGMPPGPPQAFPTQGPYGTVVPSPHRTPAVPRPYASSASPPDGSATMVRQSPQHSLSTSTLNGSAAAAAAAPRMYSSDRVLSASVAAPPPPPPSSSSPPVTQSSQVSPVGRMGDTLPAASRGRQGSVNGAAGGRGGGGTTGATGASASPSLKNLLS